jgi:hypothetical protein
VSFANENEVDREEFLAMASRSSAEVKQLRAQIAYLAPKAQAYDLLVTIIGMVPRQTGAVGEDLAQAVPAISQRATSRATSWCSSPYRRHPAHSR